MMYHHVVRAVITGKKDKSAPSLLQKQIIVVTYYSYVPESTKSLGSNREEGVN